MCQQSIFFFSSRRRHTRLTCDWSSDVCSSDLAQLFPQGIETSWIKPGRAVWKYLDGGDSSIGGTKEFCRLAGELGFRSEERRVGKECRSRLPPYHYKKIGDRISLLD